MTIQEGTLETTPEAVLENTTTWLKQMATEGWVLTNEVADALIADMELLHHLHMENQWKIQNTCLTDKK